jgi:cytochrome c oxidase subunit III
MSADSHSLAAAAVAQDSAAAHAQHAAHDTGDRNKVGMACFLATEAAFFSTLIVAYLTYVGKDPTPPTPKGSLNLWLALANTACLVTSSVTIMLAERMLWRAARGAFLLAMIATIALGAGFLVITGYEWYGLITVDKLTIGRNLFGTTYFTLVGFHAAHVSMGLLVMLGVVLATAARKIDQSHAPRVEMLSWYWHFVDTVWIVILIVVYLLGR